MIYNIPKPMGSDAKEVFSFFGLCMYQAQVFEQEVVNLLAALNVSKLINLNNNQVDDIFNNLRSKTLGVLVNDARKGIDIPDDVETEIIIAKNLRNALAHSFFVKHDANFLNESGRILMIEELRETTAIIKKADALLNSISSKLWSKFDLTEELIKSELYKMKHGDSSAR